VNLKVELPSLKKDIDHKNKRFENVWSFDSEYSRLTILGSEFAYQRPEHNQMEFVTHAIMHKVNVY